MDVIGITGHKGHGKDTVAAPFIRQDYQLLKFAQPMKDMLRALYRAADVDDVTIERKIEGDLKEVPCEILGRATPRWAMQSLGTEWAKMVDPTHTIWSRIFDKKARAIGGKIICTDLRFLHEAMVLKRLDAIIIRVERPGRIPTDLHISELEMQKIPADIHVVNDGTIADLEEKANQVLRNK